MRKIFEINEKPDDSKEGVLHRIRRRAGILIDLSHTGALVEPTSYEFSPSYVHHNGKYATIAQLYCRRGSNRQMTFSDVLDILPTHPRKGVKIYFMEYDGVIKDSEKNDLIKKNASGGKKTIQAEEERTIKAARGDKNQQMADRLFHHEKDESERETDKSDIEDFNRYELTLDSPEPVVYYRFQIEIVGDDKAEIEEQLNDMNTLLNQRHAGMQWDSTAGDQKERFVSLYAPLRKLNRVDTSTGRNYAGINFAASPALCDERGIPIGDDVLSLVGSSAIFDFDGSFAKSHRQTAYIAVPSSERLGLYEADGQSHISVASVAAQACANDCVLNGHRVAHIVLNGWDYLDGTRRFARDVSDDVLDAAFATYDVARVTINPLQGFGRKNEVAAVYARLKEKLTNIFDILNDYNFENGSNGDLLRATTVKIIDSFYRQRGLWKPDSDVRPDDAMIVELRHPEAYPTMSQLLNAFTTAEDTERRRNSTNLADVAYTLHANLTASLSSAMAILGHQTSIADSNALQTYYDFSNITSDTMRQVQFINILDYVLYTLKPNDLLVIHGTDQLHRYVLSTMVSDVLRAAQRRGVRLLFVFDTISSPQLRAFDGANPADLFSMRGAYYIDFGSDPAWTMVGAMLADELDRYKEIMNDTNFSDIISAYAQTRGRCQVLLHRDLGQTNNFIRLAPVI